MSEEQLDHSATSNKRKEVAIARVCHEVNRVYCESIGDNSQEEWHKTPEWQRQSAINGVEYYIEQMESPNRKGTPMAPEEMHENWRRSKLADGWKFGPEKNPKLKVHPCLVPYSDLPDSQKVKDKFFLAVVRALHS